MSKAKMIAFTAVGIILSLALFVYLRTNRANSTLDPGQQENSGGGLATSTLVVPVADTPGVGTVEIESPQTETEAQFDVTIHDEYQVEFGVGVELCGQYREVSTNELWSHVDSIAVAASGTPEAVMRSQLPQGAIVSYPWEGEAATATGDPIVTMTACESPHAIFEVQVPTSSGFRAWLIEGKLLDTLEFQVTALRFYGDY